MAGAKMWREVRRLEIPSAFATHMFGRVPPLTTQLRFEVTRSEPRALDGIATRKEVRIRLFESADASWIDLLLFVSDPRGEFLAARDAGPVYELLGCRALDADQMHVVGDDRQPRDSISLFQHFTAMHLGPLPEKDAVGLSVDFSGMSGVAISDELARRITALVGTNPYYLQILGEELVLGAEGPQLDEGTWKRVCQRVLLQLSGRLYQ